MLLLVWLASGPVGASAWPARAAEAAGQVAVPYRGVDTWYALGPGLSESRILRLARAMASDGLAAAGYRLLWMDAGWWSGTRDGAGNILVGRAAWPHGLSWLTGRLHAMGLQAGIYTDLGRRGCGSGGSRGHLQQDVDQFAAWGFDALKADFCGAASQRLDPRREYAALARALGRARPARPILLAVSDAALPSGRGYPSRAESALSASAWAPAIAASWRTGPDLGGPGYVRFAQVLRNVDFDAAQLSVATPAHDADPDYLTPTCRLTVTEAHAQLIMWATLGAPLMLSADVSRMPAGQLAPFTAPGILALDSDPAHPSRRRLAGGLELWRKDGSTASHFLTLLNPTSSPRTVAITASLAGLPAGTPLRSQNLLTGALGQSGTRLRERVAAHAALALRVIR